MEEVLLIFLRSALPVHWRTRMVHDSQYRNDIIAEDEKNTVRKPRNNRAAGLTAQYGELKRV